MNPKLQKLQEMMNLINEGMTRQDFRDAFKLVMKVVADLKKGNETEWTLIHSAMQIAQKKMETEMSKEMDTGKKDAMNYCMKEMSTMMRTMDKMQKEQMDGMKFVYDKVSKLKDGAPGKDGKDGIDGKDGKDGAAGKDGAPGRIMTPAKAYMVHIKDCTSQCNGSNKSFYVGGTHRGIIGVYSTQAPINYRPIIDYTENATGITLTSTVSAPDTGQSLIIQFLK